MYERRITMNWWFLLLFWEFFSLCGSICLFFSQFKITIVGLVLFKWYAKRRLERCEYDARIQTHSVWLELLKITVECYSSSVQPHSTGRQIKTSQREHSSHAECPLVFSARCRSRAKTLISLFILLDVSLGATNQYN